MKIEIVRHKDWALTQEMQSDAQIIEKVTSMIESFIKQNEVEPIGLEDLRMTIWGNAETPESWTEEQAVDTTGYSQVNANTFVVQTYLFSWAFKVWFDDDELEDADPNHIIDIYYGELAQQVYLVLNELYPAENRPNGKARYRVNHPEAEHLYYLENPQEMRALVFSCNFAKSPRKILFDTVSFATANGWTHGRNKWVPPLRPFPNVFWTGKYNNTDNEPTIFVTINGLQLACEALEKEGYEDVDIQLGDLNYEATGTKDGKKHRFDVSLDEEMDKLNLTINMKMSV